MGKKWTDESARSYVAKVQAGRNQIGLTYCSAMDYLVNHENEFVNAEEILEYMKKNKQEVGLTTIYRFF